MTSIDIARNLLDRFPVSQANHTAWMNLRAHIWQTGARLFWLRGHFHHQRACPICGRRWRIDLDDLRIDHAFAQLASADSSLRVDRSRFALPRARIAVEKKTKPNRSKNGLTPRESVQLNLNIDSADAGASIRPIE